MSFSMIMMKYLLTATGVFTSDFFLSYTWVGVGVGGGGGGLPWQ